MPVLHFKGKPFLKSYHHTVEFHRLVERPEKSLTDSPSLDDNLIIHGDNLKALKALLPTHAGKVKCIYIDPPYNTGNEGWVYNDNVNSPMIKKWLGQVVDKEDLSRHDKWCCMMYPRLVLLRELLRDDGVIFISIDDNEVHHLRCMMDEIYGEEDFITMISWQRKKESANDSKNISVKAEYILVYSKSPLSQLHLLPLSEDYIQESYNDPTEEFPDGKWRPVPIATTKGHKSGGYTYEIITPTGKSHKREWAYPEASFKKLLVEGRIYFGKDRSGVPQRIIYSHESRGIPASNIWNNLWDDVATNKQGKNEILNVFEENIFDTPKPERLIKRILQLSTNNDSIVLDSFAGSGTTAHAVLDQNKEDGGRRKFILVECEEYADKITAERVRRVIKGIPAAKEQKLRTGLGGSFSFYELGDPIDIDAMLDGTDLPSFADLAKYVFYTATGEQIDLKKPEPDRYYVGSSKTFEVFLVYEPDKKRLKQLALNSTFAEEIHRRFPNRRKLVFAPCCYLDDWLMGDLNISFAQLPFEIYRIAA
jgi:adenine-specific DNA-methyltransferase